jgi:hypothetical protein
MEEHASQHGDVTIYDGGVGHLTNDSQLGLVVRRFKIEKGIEFFIPSIVGTGMDFIHKGSGATSSFEEVVDVSLIAASSRFHGILGFLVVEGLETLKVSLIDGR